MDSKKGMSLELLGSNDKLVLPKMMLLDILVCTETLLDSFRDILNSLVALWIVVVLDDYTKCHVIKTPNIIIFLFDINSNAITYVWYDMYNIIPFQFLIC